MKKPRTRKDIAKAFLRRAATGKVREAYQSFIDTGFRHHNPYFPGDAESLMKGMEEAHAKFPQTAIKGARIVELWDIGMEAPQDSPNQHGMF